MQIAYIIIAYKNFDQVARLIARLDDASSHFLLIIDRKTPEAAVESFRMEMAGRSNVIVLDRVSIQWGQFSLTAANIIGIRELFKRSVPFDYVFTMSGQDYPLMNPSNIRRTLAGIEGKSFLEYSPFPISEWIDEGQGRLYSWNIFLPKRKVIQIPKATVAEKPITRLIYRMLGWFVPWRGALPGGMQPFGGSMHWTLSREAAKYVDEFIVSHPEYVRRFRFTLVSDEIFFQTILANSPLSHKLINNDQRYLRWPEAHAPSPSILTIADLDVLNKCGKIFARKFDISVDASILDELDKMAEERAG